MAIRKSEGIILASANWSESSQTLTLFTPDRGKLKLHVRGGRRINGKRGRPLRFARLEFSFYLREDSESGYLSEVEPVEVFLFDKDGQLGRLALASAALELLDHLLTVSDPQPAVYQLTLSLLRLVNTLDKKQLPGLFAGYILRLVSFLGYRPNLAGCAGCGRSAGEISGGPSELFFSPRRGGLVCGNCRPGLPGENHLIPLAGSLHEKMLHLMESSMEEAAQTPVKLEELHATVDLIIVLLKFHAGEIRPLKSLDFLDKLARAVKTFGG